MAVRKFSGILRLLKGIWSGVIIKRKKRETALNSIRVASNALGALSRVNLDIYGSATRFSKALGRQNPLVSLSFLKMQNTVFELLRDFIYMLFLSKFMKKIVSFKLAVRKFSGILRLLRGRSGVKKKKKCPH